MNHRTKSPRSKLKSLRPFVTPKSRWHDKDQLDAREEGWGIFNLDNSDKCAIQRVDEMGLLDSDDAALVLVLGMAQTHKSRLHRKALCAVANLRLP